jgi:MFS superfamily sulfate permease-like transporter
VAGWLGHFRADMVGGLVSAAIAIPLAMGYGMFAFTSLGENYFADGAIAGLTTALVVAVVCVVLGDKTTTVYAPRVNTTFFLGILIYGLVHSDEPQWPAGSIGSAVAFRSLFSAERAGAARTVKLGTLIVRANRSWRPFRTPALRSFSRTNPRSVASTTGAVHEGAGAVGFDKPLSVLAAITLPAIWNARNLVLKLPSILLGIAVGCALYYLGQLVGLGDHLGPVVASGERAPMGPTIFPYLMDLKHSEDLLALTPTIFGGAVALAIIASIDALLCTKLVMAPGETRRDGNACSANWASRT